MLDDRYRAIVAPGLDHTAAEPTICRMPANRIAVPPVKQYTSYSCGPAAALSMLRYWRWETFSRVDEASLHMPLRTTETQGTEPEPIVEYLREIVGLDAEYRHGDVTLAELERAVDAGQPPVVDLQAWRDEPRPWRDTWDAGHYVILVGYDADRLFVMDPSVLTPGAYAFLPRAELDERWHDLAGMDELRLERMAIFVRGPGCHWMPDEPVETSATRLA
jgi:predicted double-glycine peptidase